MKQTIKTLAIAVAMIAAAQITNAQQYTVNTTVNASARILKPITFQSAQVNFGAVVAGGSGTFLNPLGSDPAGPATSGGNINAGVNSSEVGRLVVDATAEEPIKITAPAVVILTHTGTPAEEIDWVPMISARFGDLLGTFTPSALADATLLGSTNPGGWASANVTSANGTGIGTTFYVATEGASEKATLYLGGWLFDGAGVTTPGATPSGTVIPSNKLPGQYTGVANFTFEYEL